MNEFYVRFVGHQKVRIIAMFVTLDLHTIFYIQSVNLFYSTVASNATRLSSSGTVYIDIRPKLNKYLHRLLIDI